MSSQATFMKISPHDGSVLFLAVLFCFSQTNAAIAQPTGSSGKDPTTRAFLAKPGRSSSSSSTRKKADLWFPRDKDIDWVIPAVSALNLAEPQGGYQRGLRTGATLVTINLTPPELRNDYLLYKRDRFIMTEERVLEALDAEGLAVSKQSLVDYYQAAHPPPLNGHPYPAATAAV